MARIGMIISTEERNKHIIGQTERITTDVVAGWCGVDIVERVTFDRNTAGTLTINVEGRKYKLPNIRKADTFAALRCFLQSPQAEMNKYAVK